EAGSAVIISAGFAERGTDSGQELQQRVGAFARESGLRFTGPNCLGVANVREDIWATASSRTLGGLTGHIGLLSQSAATRFWPVPPARGGQRHRLEPHHLDRERNRSRLRGFRALSR